MIKELIEKNRSYRRFHADRTVDRETLISLVDSARISSSAGNLQRIRFAVFNSEDNNKALFESLVFAAYLKGTWGGPAPKERPSAYIVLLTEKKPDVNLAIDIGIAAEAILLTATEVGLGGCIFRSFSSENIERLVDFKGYSPELVIALGYPSERVVLTDVGSDGSIKYYRDKEDVHVVPKRSLDELIVKLG